MTIDLSKLSTKPAGFGDCAKCAYRSQGTAAICYTCAAQRLDSPPEKRCGVCCHEALPSGGCPNKLCAAYDRWFDRCHCISLKRTGSQIEKAIHKYKYPPGNQGWALIFGRILVGFLEEHRTLFAPFDLIVASPSFVDPAAGGRSWDHTRRVLQAADSAAPSRWPFDIVGAAVITKTRATTPMAGLKGSRRKEIAETELRDALAIPSTVRSAGRTVLVYDDVFTDGLTLNEVARCLRLTGGATSVSGIALARQTWGGK